MDSFKIKKGLGRGLSSLIGDDKKDIKTDSIAVGDLKRNSFQPRKIFDNDKLEDLSKSIKERGIIQPIIVRRSKDPTAKFEIIAGERRWLAAQRAGLHTVPIVVTEADDLKSLEIAIIENIQRHDLNSIEEAKGYQKLIDEFSYDQERVAKFIGKSRSHISNSLRILSLPKEVISLVENNKLSQGHAKILVGMENAFFLAKKIIDKKLSVRQAENLVKIFRTKTIRKQKVKDPNLKHLEISIMEKIGLNVEIKNKRKNSGSIIFEYKEIDQLNKLIEVIKLHY